MDDDGWVNEIRFLGPLLLAWTALTALVANWWKHRNERRRDLNIEKAGDWDRLRSERDVAGEERDLVRDRWAQCESEKNEWMGRAIKAEATLQGWSEARQRLALEDAAERIVADNKTVPGNGGGK